MIAPGSKVFVLLLWPTPAAVVFLLWPSFGCSLVIGTSAITLAVTFSELDLDP